MNELHYKALMRLTPCGYCHADTGENCVSKRGRDTAMHSSRWWTADKIRRRMSAAWKQGHRRCPCLQYAGLGEPCTNPYELEGER